MDDQVHLAEWTRNSSAPAGVSDAVATFLHALKLLLHKDMEGVVQMYAEEGVMEYPFAPKGWPERVTGHQELRKHMRDYPDHLDIKRFTDLTIYETVNPEVIIPEFTAEGVVVQTGRTYQSRYLDIVTT